MTIQQERDKAQVELDPAGADEIVSRETPVIDDTAGQVFDDLLVPAATAAPAGRLSRSVRATGRGAVVLLTFLVGAALGFGAGWGYGPGLVEGAHGTDLLPTYAGWPWFWWALLASVPVALALAFSRRLRPAAFGYVLALPWQLALSVGYALVTFGTWGFAPLP